MRISASCRYLVKKYNMFNKKLKEKINDIIEQRDEERRQENARIKQLQEELKSTKEEMSRKLDREAMNIGNLVESKMKGMSGVFRDKIEKEVEMRKGFEKTFKDINKSVKQKVEIEVESLDHRMSIEGERLDSKIEDTVKTIEKSIVDKFKQLEMFKASEEILGNNAFGEAIIQELTKRAFSKKEEELREERRSIRREMTKVQNRSKEINKLKNIGSKSKLEIQKTIAELENEMHDAGRRTTSKGDEHYIKKEAFQIIINFLNKWLEEK